MEIQVTQAEPSHSEFIAQTLSIYFEENNKVNSYNEYKTDYDLLLKHIDKRISMNDQTFKYLVAMDKETQALTGFANYLIDRNKNIGEILVIVPVDKDDVTTVSTLLLETINELKANNLNEILIEIGPLDSIISEQLKEFNSRLLSQKVVVSI